MTADPGNAHTRSMHEFSSVFDVPLWRRVFSPLSVVAYATWLAIALAVVRFPELFAGDWRQWAGVAALLAMLALFVLRAMREPVEVERTAGINVVLQGCMVVLAEALLQRGQTSVLLVVVAGQMILLMSVRATIGWLLAFNLMFALLWLERGASLTQSLLWLIPIAAFQAFACLTGYYAGASERARERLTEVNAELLATRQLLEESARSGERLKLSRELHDVAGHKLTALKLNLARLQRDPALAAREEVRIAAELADELLQDIRSVVSELRAHDGLDLRGALETLARPLPCARVEVEVERGLRVDDLAQAEAILRCAQEAITNALRHGRASRIRVRCRHDADGITLQVENDGVAPERIVPGNGLAGMRERIEALGGELDIQPLAPRGLRVVARLPARRA